MAVTAFPLSGSTLGLPLLVTGTATDTPTTIHTAATATADGKMDELWLWAHCPATASALLTLTFDNGTDPDDLMYESVASRDGYTLVVPGLRIAQGKVLKGFCTASDRITVVGNVNRFT